MQNQDALFSEGDAIVVAFFNRLSPMRNIYLIWHIHPGGQIRLVAGGVSQGGWSM
ncbi:MAG: hypothetical protein LBG73_01575 [Spirochaetaceae bacterium]|jgi:hypothetical protein|nr:hypothetical protein [Spirochaetaceae bacterium]